MAAWWRRGCAPARSRESAPPPLLQGPGKKWEHTETNQNGKPVRVSMHVRKGDTVKVRMGQLAGSRERAARGGLAGLRQQQPLSLLRSCTGLPACLPWRSVQPRMWRPRQSRPPPPPAPCPPLC